MTKKKSKIRIGNVKGDVTISQDQSGGTTAHETGTATGKKHSKFVWSIITAIFVVASIATILTYFDVKPIKENKMPKGEEEKISIGDVNGDVVISQNQSGGITAGRIDQININKKVDSIIRSLEFRITLDSFLKEGCKIQEGTSAGLANVLALFSKDKKRYRFITNYQFTVSKLESGKQRLTLVYKPEDPNQMLGKKINFLKSIDVLVISYSKFLNTVKLDIDKNKPMIFNCDFYLNGVKVISFSEQVPASTICDGQSTMNLDFNDISETYERKSI